MNKVIKIILSTFLALIIFLAGWFGHAMIKSQQKQQKKSKKPLGDLNEQHKKDLNSLQDDYEKKLKKKDGIISELKKIIDRLTQFLNL